MATVALRLGPADHGRMMTREEFEQADEEPGFRYELARGALEVTMTPGIPHAFMVWLLLGRVRDYEVQRPDIILLAGGSAEFRLWVPEMGSGRHPDVAVVVRGAVRDPRDHFRPALVMEVVSEGAAAYERDYVAKREEYLAYGIYEYWIVDRFQQRVTVLIRVGDTWSETIFAAPHSAKGVVLPGFSVAVADLWDAAEQAPRQEP
jgi:Uma2 family endonuclease